MMFFQVIYEYYDDATGKEQIGKFREKIKENKEKYEEYLRKERERHKIKIFMITFT